MVSVSSMDAPPSMARPRTAGARDMVVLVADLSATLFLLLLGLVATGDSMYAPHPDILKKNAVY